VPLTTRRILSAALPGRSINPTCRRLPGSTSFTDRLCPDRSVLSRWLPVGGRTTLFET